MPRFATRAIVAATCALALLSSSAARANLPQGAVVTTVAGGGPAGLADGTARSARFLEPTGIVAASDGTLYIADRAAQRIRVIARDGSVTTLAGGGELDATGLIVAGGYRDGPSGDARFDTPGGMTLGPDGSLYIADELNHCIRRYRAGVVSTFAGDPRRPGKADGALAAASFEFPTDVKLDASGNLFVADTGVGIREIGADGIVRTLATPGIGPAFTGLSIGGEGDDETLFIADGTEGMGLYSVADGTSQRALALEGDGDFGTPVAVRALSAHDAVFADARSHTIRYFRAPRLPQLSRSFVRIIAGGRDTVPQSNAGSADGAPYDARFDAPAGIDLAPDGTYVVADARNRAVRDVPAVDRRGPVLAFADYDAPASDYRIVYLSASIAFWNTLWPDSVPGLLERRLANDASRVGLARVPHVYAVRLDGASTSAMRSYIEQVLSQGVADCVVLNYGIAFVNLDTATDRSLQAQAAWSGYVSDQLRAMGASLARAKVGFAVVQLPVFSDASPAEMLYARELYVPQDYDTNFATASALRAAIRASGVPTLDLLPAIRRYESAPQRVPLFQTDGPHQTGAGNAMTADAIAAYLEAMRPWAARAAARDHGRDRTISRAIASPTNALPAAER